MATTATNATRPLHADSYEKTLSVGAAMLLIAVAVALAKGHAQWGQVTLNIWAHLLTILVALALTPVMLLRPRGDRLHRQLGYIWATALLLTALISFTVRTSGHGGFSVIHILSAWVVIQVPIIILSARRHNLRRHRMAVRGMVTGALPIAGFFTFPFDRLMGQWLFS